MPRHKKVQEDEQSMLEAKQEIQEIRRKVRQKKEEEKEKARKEAEEKKQKERELQLAEGRIVAYPPILSDKSRKRSEEDKRQMTIRLNRIEGQVGGIRKLLDNDAYCIDILVQAAAVNAGMHNFIRDLLNEHISNCVAEDLRNGHDEKLQELLHYLPKFLQ